MLSRIELYTSMGYIALGFRSLGFGKACTIMLFGTSYNNYFGVLSNAAT